MTVVPFSSPSRTAIPFPDPSCLGQEIHDHPRAKSVGSDQARALLHEAERVIAEQRESIRRLQDQIVTDPLTGLGNKRGFMIALRRALACVRRDERNAGALVLIDIDGLKQINEALGRGAGDAYLQTFGSVLLYAVRSGDDVARLEGDTFAILMTQMNARDVSERLTRLEKTVAGRVMHYRGKAVPLHASFGYAFLDEEQTPESALVAAETHLFSVKAKRRVGAAAG